jgi:hypothetical protein
MRTVTFSTPEIQNAIARHFIALNSNISGDPTAGASINHAPGDAPGSCIRGNGQQNVQVIFLTPDLKILHAATGYLDPNDLYEEMQFAAQLFEKLKSSPQSAEELVREAHRERLKNAGFSAEEIDARTEMDLIRAQMAAGNSRATGIPAKAPAQPVPPRADELFAFMIRGNVLRDHRYSLMHPLMPVETFETDPGELVGRGQTFFSSSSSSGNSPRPNR